MKGILVSVTSDNIVNLTKNIRSRVWLVELLIKILDLFFEMVFNNKYFSIKSTGKILF